MKRVKNINLTEGLALQLEARAAETGLSMSDIVRRALEEYFAREAKNGSPKE